jgi:hypothetical protein
MTNSRYAPLSVVGLATINLMLGCATATRVGVYETVAIDLGADWVIASKTPFKESSKIYAITYTRRNPSLGESVTILSSRQDIPLRQLSERIERAQKTRCPDSEAQVLSSDDRSVLIEVSTIFCSESKLIRVIDGNKERFSITYTIAVKTLEQPDRHMWVEKLAGARLVPID